MAGGCLTQTQCNCLLQPSVKSAEQSAAAIFGTQCPCIQAVLVDMTYNLGAGGMLEGTEEGTRVAVVASWCC